MRMTLKTLVLFASASIVTAQAQILVDHQPYAAGGSGSDTLLPNTSLPFIWQLSTDDFVLASAASVKQVNWWGYHAEGAAPQSETMRIRLYNSRPLDALPNELLFEESVDNPDRIDTGRTIGIGGRPIEYRYHVALATPWDLEQGVPYWLEVAQLGDNLSGFRFEYSRADTNSFAFRNNLFPDWRRFTGTSDLAFQLIVPEPATAALILFGALGLGRRIKP